MKTLETLLLIAVLFTIAAWFSLQGVSNATIRVASEVPMAEAKPVQRHSAPVRATTSQKHDKMPAAPSKPKAPSPFQVALEAADLCEVSRLLNGSYQTQDIYAAIVATMSPSPAVQEAYGEKGPMLLGTPGEKPKFTHATTELLWALRAAGFLYTPVGGGGDDAKGALALISELEKKDPTNGVYPFFRLSLEEKLGLPKEKLKETAMKIASSGSFDSGLEPMEREFRDAFWQNPAMHYALSYVFSSVSPSWYAPVNTLRKMSEEKEFDGLKRVAELMTEKGLRSHRSWQTGEYDLQQYNTGRSLVQGMAGFPDWTELDAEKGQKPQGYPSAQPWVTDQMTGERRCDPGPYEAFFYEARENR